jgi:hypothetical protein
MQRGLAPHGERGCRDMRVGISHQQRCLEEQDARIPDSRAPAQQRQHHLREHRLDNEDERRPGEQCGGKEDARQRRRRGGCTRCGGSHIRRVHLCLRRRVVFSRTSSLREPRVAHNVAIDARTRRRTKSQQAFCGEQSHSDATCRDADKNDTHVVCHHRKVAPIARVNEGRHSRRTTGCYSFFLFNHKPTDWTRPATDSLAVSAIPRCVSRRQSTREALLRHTSEFRQAPGYDQKSRALIATYVDPRLPAGARWVNYSGDLAASRFNAASVPRCHHGRTPA